MYANLGFTVVACGIGAWGLARGRALPPLIACALAALVLWGFAQWAFGATENRYVTLNTALRYAGYAALAIAAHSFLREPMRERVLAAAMWVALGIAVLSVLAYYTSPNRVLWIFAAPYPDVWGPFLSRNHFAQFLELTLPIALWQAARGSGFAWAASAAILAAGLASASRAGAALLLAEAMVILLRLVPVRRAVAFLAAALALAGIAGGDTLLGRLGQPDPLRPEIYRSALAMIAERPLTGYGLGTFAVVYPEFARFDAGVTIDRAHNDWLEWTVEGGVPFAIVWAVLLAATVRAALGSAWTSVWGLGIVAVFLHALVDYPFASIGVSAWAFLGMGAVASENRSTRAPLY